MKHAFYLLLFIFGAARAQQLTHDVKSILNVFGTEINK